jgi:prepilin-type processing-associated H-X9-DG protein
MFGDAINAATESSNRRERMDRFKQVAAGMISYDDVNKYFPPAAIRDKDGKPLLSWRVAILPYIGQYDLYVQFHLDEPWDSPHNRVLIEKMPGTYMDLGTKATQLNHEGKTTVQVPVGPQTVFDKKEGTRSSEMKDGTSKTIFLVEVEPSKAVVWTKPEDWEVDLKQPRKGLERTDRSSFIAAFADGHVEIIDRSKIDDAKLRGLLTRAGGEDNE